MNVKATHARVPLEGITDDGDRLMLVAIVERHGLEAVLMSLSCHCGDRADHLAKTDAAQAKRWATLEGGLGVLVPAALAL